MNVQNTLLGVTRDEAVSDRHIVITSELHLLEGKTLELESVGSPILHQDGLVFEKKDPVEYIQVGPRALCIAAPRKLSQESLDKIESTIPNAKVRDRLIGLLESAQDRNNNGAKSDVQVFKHPTTGHYCISYHNDINSTVGAGRQMILMSADGKDIQDPPYSVNQLIFSLKDLQLEQKPELLQ